MLLVLSFFVLIFNESISQINKKDISFVNDGIQLKGTLFFPESKTPLPSIVVVHGSGKDGRFLKKYQYLAQMFSEFGFATLIYDKRGAGESEGKYINTPKILEPATDLISAINTIKHFPEIDKERIGVFAMSQGAWVAPYASTLSKDISFIAVLVGGGVSMREQKLYQQKGKLIKEGYSKETVDSMNHFAEKLYTYCGTGIGYKEMSIEYQKARKLKWFSFFNKMGFGELLSNPEQLKRSVYNYFRNIKYDPRETLEKINIPFIAILGEKDQSTPTKRTAYIMKKAFTRSGFKDYKVIVLPNETHQYMDDNNPQIELLNSYKKPLLEWLSQFKN